MYTVVTYMLDGQKRSTRIPKLGAKEANESIQSRFPKAELISAVEHRSDTESAPVAPADERLPSAAELREEATTREAAEAATLSKFTKDDQPQPHAPAPPAPAPADEHHAHATADLGKTPVAPEIQRDSARNAPAHAVVEREREVATRREALKQPPPRLTGTAASDEAVGLTGPYPQIGDSVQIDVDMIPRMQRLDIHQRLLDAGLHGKHGVVQGTEVRGGIYMLKVETGTSTDWVDARCVRHEQPPAQPQMMQDESRLSPEVMRKPKPGSYNLT